MNNKWEPWNETNVWKTKAEFFSWLRGQLRHSVWSHYPPKNEFKTSMLRKATPEDYARGISSRTKKVGQCVFCGEWFPASKLQVDHKVPAGSLRGADDIQGFVQRLACEKSIMGLACKPCHDIKTYSERQGISFEEARVEKQVIERMRLPKAEQDAMLKAQGLPCGNDKMRKESWRILLNQREVSQ